MELDAVEARKKYRDACAKAYAAAGYSLFSLGGASGKEPVAVGWPKTPYQRDPLPYLTQYNFGVVLTDTDLVIDVDPRNFKEGDNPAARLLQDMGEKLVTYVVKTGGGGRHIYLRKPAAVKIRKNLKEYPGIDFLSAGCYVVGAGCLHRKTGNIYQIAALGPGKCAQAPETLLAIIAKTEPDAHITPSKGAFFDDSAANKSAYRIRAERAEPAIEGQGGDMATYRLACIGKDMGLPPASVTEILLEVWNPKCQPPWGADELLEKVRNAYLYGKKAPGVVNAQVEFSAVPGAAPAAHTATGKGDAAPEFVQKPVSGKVVPNLNNTVAYLTRPHTGLDGLFRYNQFSNLVEFARVPPWLKGTATDEDTVGRAITDTDIIRLRAYLATMKGYEIATQTLMDAVSEAAQRLTTHPVREWLNALTWDGKPRCNTWLTKYAGAEESLYTAAVGRKFLCGAVSRIFWPGCKFDSMLVLEGPQNAGKSRLCKALGGKWFGDPVVDPHARDTIAALASKWIVELAEMEVTRRAEVAALKAFISRQEDRARLAYGRISQDYPRQCVFIGTINPETDGAYLKDTTGNRRFWPVAVGSRLDVEGLQEAREQLFAEAVFLVRGGEKLYLDTPELVAAATVEAQKRAIVSPWAEAIMQWLAVPDPATGKLRTDVTAREVYLGALSGRDEAMKRQHTLEIGATLQLLGYAPAWGSRNGLTARVFKKEE